MGGVDITPQELEAFYERVDELCAEIFDASQEDHADSAAGVGEQAQS